MESIREEESLQAIDYLRWVYAQQAKHIYLISNLLLPGIEPDVLNHAGRRITAGTYRRRCCGDGVISRPELRNWLPGHS
ncbi:MAG: hypothetical protein IPL99_29765 [Candidatus Competibacteraceae bacterium]|nr:hypothetical protein [Candidatus Competibacteraceae bacterium]